MADDPVTKEEADRIAEAKAALGAYPPSVDAAAGPSQDMLNQAAADQDAKPAGDAPLRAKFDALVSEYSNAPTQPATPAAESPEAAAIEEAKRHGLAPPEAPGEPEAPSQPFSLTGLVAPKEYAAATGATGKGQVATADDEAARRAEFNELNAARSQAADARLAPANRGAVIVSPGGMRPSSVTRQVTQGPAVKDADALLADYQTNATRGAEGDAAAGKERDTAIAGLESDFAQGSAKLAGGEQQAAQKQSAALSEVSDRMSKALDAARVPIVSPAQELSSMGIGQKLAFALAAAGGGIAGRATGQNPFLQGYNQMVDARIATQKAQAEQSTNYAKGQENLYSVMKQGFQSDDGARAALRTMYLQALDTKLKEAVTHYNIDAANPHVLQLKAGIDQQLLANQEELAKISGKHFSKEETSKYVAPSAIVIGGTDAKEREKSDALYKKLQEVGADKSEADLDTLNNVVGALDKTGAVQRYAAEHGQSYANAYFAMSNDPAQRQFIVDVQRGLKSEVSGNGMRSELGREVAKTIDNPNTATELYNRLAKEHAKAVASAIAASGDPEDYQRYLRNRQRAQDIQHATNSPVRAQGATPLPDALPQINQTVEPAPVATSGTGAQREDKSTHHHKKLK